MTPVVKPPAVQQFDWPKEDKSVNLFADVVREVLMPPEGPMKCNVVLCVSKGGYEEPSSRPGPDLNLWFNCTPCPNARMKHALTNTPQVIGLLAFQEPCYRKHYPASDLNTVKIVDDSTKFVMAEWIGNNVYILFDLAGQKGTPKELRLFRKILEGLLEHIRAAVKKNRKNAIKNAPPVSTINKTYNEEDYEPLTPAEALHEVSRLVNLNWPAGGLERYRNPWYFKKDGVLVGVNPPLFMTWDMAAKYLVFNDTLMPFAKLKIRVT